MDQEAIGAFIAQCRKEQNLTQAQLAEQLGVSDRSVSRWENGKTMPDLSLYEPLCQALGCQVSELLYGKRMSEEERRVQGEETALRMLATGSQLETLGILTELLIVVGILIAITFTRLFAVTTVQRIIVLCAGCFVWGFGLFLRTRIRKALTELKKDPE